MPPSSQSSLHNEHSTLLSAFTSNDLGAEPVAETNHLNNNIEI